MCQLVEPDALGEERGAEANYRAVEAIAAAVSGAHYPRIPSQEPSIAEKKATKSETARGNLARIWAVGLRTAVTVRDEMRKEAMVERTRRRRWRGIGGEDGED